jgi:hypothetical protein
MRQLGDVHRTHRPIILALMELEYAKCNGVRMSCVAEAYASRRRYGRFAWSSPFLNGSTAYVVFLTPKFFFSRRVKCETDIAGLNGMN